MSMHQNNHTYFEFGGVKYYDYTMYTDCYLWTNESSFLTELCLSEDMYAKLRTLDDWVTPGITVPKQSEIYVAPLCSVASDDIRKNYQVKRRPDTGDYNVFSPIKHGTHYRHTITGRCLLILPTRKVVLASSCLRQERDLIALCQGIITIDDNDIQQAIYSTESMSFYRMSDDVFFFKNLLDGIISKPIVTPKQLDLNTENELTLDVLQLVYTTGSASYCDQDAKKNFLIQLNVLNQHNWRDYKGTVRMLLRELCVHGICSDIRRKVSSQNKAIRVLFESCNKCSGFTSEKDLKMAQTFVNQLLDIGDCRYTDVQTLENKLSNINLSLGSFCNLYSNIIKLTPRQYAEQS